jgi:AcrR family transcriptional regulator
VTASAKKKPKGTATSSAPSAARAHIIAEARKHFFAHGFRGVTMDDLAVELGMSKKTVYAHFPSKTELLEVVVKEKMQSAHQDLQRVMAEMPDQVVPTLHALLACIQGHAAEFQPAFFRDIRRESPELFTWVQVMRRENIQRTFGRVLADGQRRGMIRTDIPVNVLIEILMTLADSLVNPSKLAELGMSAKEGVTAVISLFLEGAISAEGRAQRSPV